MSEIFKPFQELAIPQPLGTEGRERKNNPFSSALSGYGHVVNEKFVSTYPEGSAMYGFHLNAQNYFKGFVGEKDFPCVAGRTVARTDQYAFCAYPDMTNPQLAEGIMHDMIQFQHEFGIPDDPKPNGKRFRSFVAAFAEPHITSPLHGAEALYTLLGNMHDVNAQHYPWKEGFSNDMESSDFGYSAGESAFFIAFFHPEAHDAARRSDVTFVVFNSHAMLESLKDEGKFNKLRDIIRSRQDSVHPYLGNHGEVKEWRQYALLSPDVETEAAEQAIRQKVLGECPFNVRPPRVDHTYSK